VSQQINETTNTPTTLKTIEAELHPLFNSENLGVMLVVFGIVTIALAAWRYNRVFWQIERGNYRPNRLIIWITTGIVMVLGTFYVGWARVINLETLYIIVRCSCPPHGNFTEEKFSSGDSSKIPDLSLRKIIIYLIKQVLVDIKQALLYVINYYL
jgi:hypothetical protein